MKRISFLLFAVASLLTAQHTLAQTLTLSSAANEAANYTLAPDYAENPDTGKQTKSKYVMDAQPDPIGVKKKQKQNFDFRFFKFDAGIVSFMGGKDAPYKSGYYADMSFVGQAFKKKGAFEWMYGCARHTPEKLWSARSVGVPVDSVKSVSHGFEMYTGLVLFWNVVNKKKIAVLTGIELPVSFSFFPDVDSKVLGTQSYIDMIFDFTPGVKVTALIGNHLVANAEYLVSTTGFHKFENYSTNIKTSIPMNLNVTRIGIGYRF